VSTLHLPAPRIPSWSPSKPPDDWSATKMSDLVFVILTCAFFALAALIVRGVDRL
jgi:hypothetical protein